MGSSGGGSPSNTTQTTVTEPPEEVRPYIGPFMRNAERLSRTPFSEYGGERISPLTKYHGAGLNMVAGRSLYGDPAVEAGRGMLTGALSGDYFNDPAYAAAFNRNADLIAQRIGTMAGQGSSGLTNTGLQEQHRDMLTDLGEKMAYRERGLLPSHLQSALAYGQEPYQAAQRLMGAGDIVRSFDQDRINEAMRAFRAQQQWPFQMADVMGNAIRMGMGGGGTVTQTSPGYYESDQTANLLGAGLVGAGLYDQWKQPTTGISGGGR